MKIREENYGISKEEADSLRKYCQKANIDDQMKLLQYSFDSNPDISSDIYYSLVNGLSYDKMMKARYIPINRYDFYAYQRKCMSMFRQYLVSVGKWN